MSQEFPNQPPRQPWQDRLHETADLIEDEVRKLATYINDEVVPDVRRYGSEALRSAAIELHKLAQKLDDEGGRSAPPPGAPRP